LNVAIDSVMWKLQVHKTRRNYIARQYEDVEDINPNQFGGNKGNVQ